ncbi:hypothetical protein LX36DRAFT_680801 [Colletotrichum falcatum]|nr:hypothetical protein LX36DRAFT_680801 [Colletotrichum falcatum]
MASVEIMSDLHLSHQDYKSYHIKPTAPYLALFWRRRLTALRIVFHVLGNHEPYGSSRDDTAERLQSFQEANRRKTRSRPGEYAVPDTNIAILGCALFSSVPGARLTAVSNGLSDFCAIDGWTVEEHCQRHDGDLAWLNARVETMTRDPGRTVVVFTHHGPTENSRAVAPLHADSDIRSGFSTDLRGQPCWENAQVKLWAFGHTHYNCGFVDEETGKRICTNQKGYSDGTLVAFREGNVVRIG